MLFLQALRVAVPSRFLEPLAFDRAFIGARLARPPLHTYVAQSCENLFLLGSNIIVSAPCLHVSMC